MSLQRFARGAIIVPLLTLAASVVCAGSPVARSAVAAAPTATPPTRPRSEGSLRYQPPVEGTVTDPFRAPANPYGPGNRGLEIATAPGAVVQAAADGRVAFAGPVAGELHVSIDHPDGTRTTVSFLAQITVRAGQQVARGQPIGVSDGSVHFGARRNGAYIDPLGLLSAGGRRGVVLVKDGARRAAVAPAPGGRRGWRRAAGYFTGKVRGGARVVAKGAVKAGSAAARAGRSVVRKGAKVFKAPARAVKVGWRTLAALPGWFFRECTPARVNPPPVRERRLAVLVPGLSSHLEGGFPRNFDTRSLGYDPHDVDVFSYRGGAQPYGPSETGGDLRAFGETLRSFLIARAQRAPGVPIDVIAHSQGGVVARLALSGGSGALPPIGHLITLDSPHNGVPAASLLAGLNGTVLGGRAVAAIDAVTPGPSPQALSISQLAEGSALLEDLGRRPLPAGIRVTSIAARGDVVVPAPTSHLDRATNVIVDVPGLFGDHSGVVMAAAARREVALALADRPPGCDSFLNHVLDHAVGEAILEAQRAGVDVVVEYVETIEGPAARIVSPVLDRVVPVVSPG